jgi:hypothetical protein
MNLGFNLFAWESTVNPDSYLEKLLLAGGYAYSDPNYCERPGFAALVWPGVKGLAPSRLVSG